MSILIEKALNKETNVIYNMCLDTSVVADLVVTDTFSNLFTSCY